MKHDRYVLWSWVSDNQELEIDWVGAAQYLGIEFTSWIRRLDQFKARYYLYRTDFDHQLVLEVFDPETNREFQTRYALVTR